MLSGKLCYIKLKLKHGKPMSESKLKKNATLAADSTAPVVGGDRMVSSNPSVPSSGGFEYGPTTCGFVELLRSYSNFEPAVDLALLIKLLRGDGDESDGRRLLGLD